MTESRSQWTVPNNSISCFIGRVCSLDSNFAKNGIMWVDFSNLNPESSSESDDDASESTTEEVPYDQEGTSQRKVIASWTLRTAYAAWKNPPIIEYRGRMNLTGSIKTDNAHIVNSSKKGNIKMTGASLTNVAISGGVPLNGTVTIPPAIPGTAVVPVAISGASGTANIECSNSDIDFTDFTINIDDPNATLFIHTGTDKVDSEDFPGGEDYTVHLKHDKNSQLPWCADIYTAENDEDVYANKREDFISVGDKALCMAFGNSMENLYCVDIFI